MVEGDPGRAQAQGRVLGTPRLLLLARHLAKALVTSSVSRRDGSAVARLGKLAAKRRVSEQYDCQVQSHLRGRCLLGRRPRPGQHIVSVIGWDTRLSEFI